MSVVWATEIRKYLCKGNSEIHEMQKKITKGNEKAKKHYFAGTDRKHAANNKNN